MTAGKSILWGALVDYHDSGAFASAKNYQTGGTYAGSAAELLDTNSGKKQSLVHLSGTYAKWGNGAGGTNPFTGTLQTNLNNIVVNGQLPCLDWAPWDWANVTANFSFRPAAITAGNWDTYITTWATACLAWGKPVLLRPLWEQNLTGQFPWQHGQSGSWAIGAGQGWGGTWTNTTADWINAWRHIVSIFQSVGCTNAKFLWCPNLRADSDSLSFASMYPGSAYVDWMGFDGYPRQSVDSIGDAARGTGNLTYLADTYTEIAAVDATKPMCIGETAWFANASGSPTAAAVTNIVASGTTWTITVATQPTSATWAATQGIIIAGSTPSGYNGTWTIASVSGAGPYTIVVNNVATPGAYTASSATCLMDDRIGRATAVAKFTDDMAGMPQVEAILFYWVRNDSPPSKESFPLDVQGTPDVQWPVDFAKFRTAIGAAQFLAGGQMASDLSTYPWLAFNDQELVAPNERYLEVLRSEIGLEVLLSLKDANGAATAADSSGKGRNGTVTGNPGFGAAAVAPAEPGWTAPSWPGAAGNNVIVADNAVFSPANNPMSWEFSVLLPTTPGASFAVVSKYQTSGSAAEWLIGFYSGNPGLACAVYTSAGALITAFNQLAWPSLGVPHHYIVTYDPSLGTNRWTVYVDGGAALIGGGTPAAGAHSDTATAIYVGQTPDAGLLWPAPSGVRYGPISIYSKLLSAEAAAEHYAAWAAAPAISAISPGTPTNNATTVTWTTDIGGSTWLEYGLTTAYGSLTALDRRRVTSHTAQITGLLPGRQYHYRVSSRNQAGTRATSADQTVATQTDFVRHFV